MRPQEYIQEILQKALSELGYPNEDERLFLLEKPKQEGFGDAASTIAMALAKPLRKPPRVLAEEIVSRLQPDPFYIEKIEIAGPGFINFYLAPSCLQQAVLEIVREGEAYGQSRHGRRKRLQLEFVSANPTGPLNIVSARAAAVGDVLTNLLNACGYDAKREYYVNDAGRQIELLGASLAARYLTELGHPTTIPEEGYHGEYLRDLARLIIQQEGDAYLSLNTEERNRLFSRKALSYMLERHQRSMTAFGVHFDRWFLESSLRETDEHLKTLEKLRRSGFTYESDGAVWFKSSAFGDEKDRVLVTSDGRPTYFLVDIAYHENKFDRGFEQVIDFWGPDHHGYIPRMSAALQALGHPKEAFRVCIIQQVNLLRNGRPVKMSKRAGEIIEMDELLEEVGVDAARYFFVDRRISQPLDFDIEVAKQQSEDNPCYYVQYAHARICSVLAHAEQRGFRIDEPVLPRALNEASALAAAKKLLDFPDVIIKAAEELEPHRLTGYLTELAALYHKFYHELQIVGENRETTESRLMLCLATRRVLANGLKLLGVSAPTRM
ncbi:MAG: arginine--tRNA ligase [candidate division KSB1 bacterium]|nr:arginine--tRNA ligase [candidate division KSB1 bacterium]